LIEQPETKRVCPFIKKKDRTGQQKLYNKLHIDYHYLIISASRKQQHFVLHQLIERPTMMSAQCFIIDLKRLFNRYARDVEREPRVKNGEISLFFVP